MRKTTLAAMVSLIASVTGAHAQAPLPAPGTLDPSRFRVSAPYLPMLPSGVRQNEVVEVELTLDRGFVGRLQCRRDGHDKWQCRHIVERR